MNEKDLFNGLTEIDEDLIDEASMKKKKKKFHFPYEWVIAACFCLVIGVTMGHLLPADRLTSSEQSAASEVAESASGAAESVSEAAEEAVADDQGTADTTVVNVGIVVQEDTGELFSRATGYSDLYDQIQEAEESYESASASSGMAMYDTDDDAEEAAIASEAADSSVASADYSTTNLITEGVDESDIIKTNGSYIFMVRSDEVKVFDIRSGKAEELTTIKPKLKAESDYVQELYVDGDQLDIIVNHYDYEDTEVWAGEEEDFAGSDVDEDVLSTENYKDQEETLVYIYDISDMSDPKETGVYTQQGTYHTSRKVGDILYLFTDTGIWLNGLDKTTALKHPTTWIPTINGLPLEAGCIYNGSDTYGYGTLISSFCTSSPDQVIDAKFFMNSTGSTYISNQAMYFYDTDYTSEKGILKLMKMSFDEGKLTPGPHTTLRGYVTDTFALNEYQGYLRVFTSELDQTANNLYILDENLRTAGKISDIAPGESIRAVRYLRDTAYVVTFEQQDPLFVLDLSDVENPKILSELKMNGYSEYLHIWDEDHVLGIGYACDDDGSQTGMKLDMYDVSNPENIILENSYVMDGEEYFCGEYDQKAILADPEKNLIGFASVSWDYETYDEEDRYSVFTYSKEDGFKKVLEKDLESYSIEEFRGLFKGDTFYIAGCGSVDSYDMSKDFEKMPDPS